MPTFKPKSSPPMPLLLHLETSAEFCSVCLSEGTTILASREGTKRFTHAAHITLFVEACLAEAGRTINEISAVSVSMGPGSYTGLRIGLSAAKGICYAIDKPLIAVSTLEALASAAYELKKEDALYIPMIDARRMEVYTATFDATQKKIRDTEAHILTETSFVEQLKNKNKVIFCGNAVEKAQTVITASHADFQLLMSNSTHLVAPALRKWHAKDFADVAYSTPFYFKSPHITTPKPNVLNKIMNDKNI